MRTVRTRVYTFSELSESAKNKAIKDAADINVDYEWWEFIYEDAKNVGLIIEESDLDFRKIKGHFENSAFETCEKIIADHGETTSTAKLAVRYHDVLQVAEADDYVCEHFLKALLNDYLNILSKEYDYQLSDKAIIETIEANEYEFTQDGRRF